MKRELGPGEGVVRLCGERGECKRGRGGGGVGLENGYSPRQLWCMEEGKEGGRNETGKQTDAINERGGEGQR